MLFKVFQALKEESRKGDFVALTNKDRLDLDISLSNSDIENMSIWKWKQIIKQKTHISAIYYLTVENMKREKIWDIIFRELKMSQYISENKRTSLARVIFSIRSKTLDIKEWNS